MNTGKRFEQNFRKSVPEDIFYYRFNDGTASWGSEKTRFQTPNMCDCMIFYKNSLFLIELKSHKGKSLPFVAIRNNQLEKMTDACRFDNILPLFIINFSDVGETYGIYAEKINEFIKTASRKSIPIDWCMKNGIEIKSVRKKVNFVYEIEQSLHEFISQKY